VCAVLLQEVVQGTSLAQMVSSGQRASEDEVMRIATDLLATLKYLGGGDTHLTHGGGWGQWWAAPTRCPPNGPSHGIQSAELEKPELSG